MNVLVVGGTGFAGGYTALHLKGKGHDVTIMGRSPTAASAPMSELPYLQGNYVEDAFDGGELEGFDAMVFAAGADITKVPPEQYGDMEPFFQKANSEGIPKFFEKAKSAGVKRVAYLGTFYPQVAPHQIGKDPYVTSRHQADEAIRAMSGTGFNVCSLNAPYILGHIPGLEVSHLGAMANYAAGHIPDIPVFAPEGGTNHVNLLTVAESLEGGLERGESGKAYLIGDANYTWKEYLELWFAAAGNPQEIAVSSDDHPLLPHLIMYAGVGATVSYSPPAEEVSLLGYGQGRMEAEIQHCAKAYLG